MGPLLKNSNKEPKLIRKLFGVTFGLGTGLSGLKRLFAQWEIGRRKFILINQFFFSLDKIGGHN